MTGMFKGRSPYAQTVEGAVEHAAREPSRQDSLSPASGLLIAVGSSLVLWAVLAQAARWAARFFF